MQQVSVGQKYQIVIPKEIRNRMPGIRPGAKVLVSLSDENTLQVSQIEKIWVEQTRGIAKNEWQNQEIDQYIQKIKDEWD